jgi:hypothetical protein
MAEELTDLEPDRIERTRIERRYVLTRRKPQGQS